jgi:hypothetical protein
VVPAWSWVWAWEHRSEAVELVPAALTDRSMDDAYSEFSA